MILCCSACCRVLQCVAVSCSVVAGHNEDERTSNEAEIRYIYVAVCCSVLQCVAVCCSVLQCVAVCWSVLQYVAVCCSACCSVVQRGIQHDIGSVLQCIAVCCSACCSVVQRGIQHNIGSVLQCVAVSYNVSQCVAVCCSVRQCVAVRVAVWYKEAYSTTLAALVCHIHMWGMFRVSHSYMYVCHISLYYVTHDWLIYFRTLLSDLMYFSILHSDMTYLMYF